MKPENLDAFLEKGIKSYSRQADLVPGVMLEVEALEIRKIRRKALALELVLLCLTLAFSACSLVLIRVFSRIYGGALGLYLKSFPSISIAAQGFFIFIGVGAAVTVLFFYRFCGKEGGEAGFPA